MGSISSMPNATVDTADILTKDFATFIVKSLVQNGYEVSIENGASRDVAFAIEVLRAAIYRQKHIAHPMQTIVDDFFGAA